jgi:predicted transposase/invertase (TIGR01784 family)
MKNQKIIRFDWAIKTILRDKANYDVLEGFLSAILRDDIKVVQLIESESNQETDRQKFNRVDIMVLDGNGQYVIIEIQNELESDYLERLLFGTSKVIVENAKLGEPYKTIKKVISISILYFNLGSGDDYIYYGSTQFKGLNTNSPLIIRKRLKMSEKKYVFKDKNIEKEIFPEYYLINVERFQDTINSDIDEWIYMLKNEEIPKHFKAKNIDKAREKLKIQAMSDEERKSYERYLINVARDIDMIETAREEGEVKGLKKGRKEGRKEGLLEGEIKAYQDLLNNQNLPDNMIHLVEQKMVDLQNNLQNQKENCS